jgi:hypothetical protein
MLPDNPVTLGTSPGLDKLSGHEDSLQAGRLKLD